MYKSKVDFLAVYISEAHATDEWKLYTDVCFKQPTTIEERVEVASKFATRLHGDMDLVIDGMNNLCRDAFSSWPERLYIIGKDGKVSDTFSSITKPSSQKFINLIEKEIKN